MVLGPFTPASPHRIAALSAKHHYLIKTAKVFPEYSESKLLTVSDIMAFGFNKLPRGLIAWPK
jgi:hypothetical protein